MTRDEIKAHVARTKFGHTDDFGERLTSLSIGYDEECEAKNVDEFVKLIS